MWLLACSISEVTHDLRFFVVIKVELELSHEKVFALPFIPISAFAVCFWHRCLINLWYFKWLHNIKSLDWSPKSSSNLLLLLCDMIKGVIKVYNIAVIVEYTFIVDSPLTLGMVKFGEDKVLTVKAKWLIFVLIATTWSSKEQTIIFFRYIAKDVPPPWFILGGLSRLLSLVIIVHCRDF